LIKANKEWVCNGLFKKLCPRRPSFEYNSLKSISLLKTKSYRIENPKKILNNPIDLASKP
jgi:hypothetical protein